MAQMGYGELPFTLAQGQTKIGEMAVARVYWFNPGTAGDLMTLQDGSGNVIVAARCESANASQWFDFSSAPISVNGVGMGALNSGTVYIYTV